MLEFKTYLIIREKYKDIITKIDEREMAVNTRIANETFEILSSLTVVASNDTCF